MKNLSAFLVSTFFLCGKTFAGGNCIDSSKINPNGVCPMIYAPVCGCDGVTYENDCVAMNHGVIFLVKGACGANGGGANGCIDPALINPNAPCPSVYDPVCGCDGVTYGNACEATNNGITSFINGTCGNGGGSGCFISPYFHYDIQPDHKTVQFMYFFWGVFPGSPNGGGQNTGGGSLSVLWNFGDGNTSTDINPVHTYSDSVNESITVCLTVYDSVSNCTESFCQPLKHYWGGDCYADFDWEIVYDSIMEKDSVVFLNNTPVSSNDSVLVNWSFGDGSVAPGSEPNSGYSYNDEGDYIVCMTIENLTTGCFEMICNVVAFRFSALSNMQENKLDKLKIYPNPASDWLAVSNVGKHTRLSIFNHQGQKLMEQPLSEGLNRINVSQLPNGLFFAKFNSGERVATKMMSIIR